MFIRARSTLYRSRWWMFQGKRFSYHIFKSFTVCSTWPSSNAMAQRVEGPEFDYWQYMFFFFFLFSFCFSFCSFVFFLYLQLLFFRFINFLPYCLISLSIQLPAIPQKSFARSCDLRLCSLKCERVLFFSKDKLVGLSSPRLNSQVSQCKIQAGSLQT